jgi:type VI secretion system protein ImpK
MTPEFSAAVDPIFEYVLDLLDRMDSGREVVPHREHDRIVQALGRAENQIERDLGASAARQWELAKFALVCWIDEMLSAQTAAVRAEQREWFIENPLQKELFNVASGAVEFFVWSKEASRTKDRDALEVYYLCVILGFRGFYEQPDLVEDFAAQYDLPRSIAEWKAKAAEGIRLVRPRGAPTEGRVGRGAPAREGYFWMLLAVFVFFITLAFAVAMAFKFIDGSWAT